MKRLRQVVLSHRHRPAAGIVSALERAIGGFTSTRAQFDDIAIVVAGRQRAEVA
jgi:hypothetical protein